MTTVGGPSVLLDATPIPASRGGVGRYVDGIVPALVEAGVRLTVVCQARDADGFRESGARVVVAPARAASTRGRLVWEQMGLPRLARALRVDVIHSVHYTFPIFTRRTHAVTVHDLTFFTHPMLHTRAKRFFFRSWIRATRFAKATVITPSRATADEYRRVTGAPESRVVVALLGFDSDLFSPPTPSAVAELSREILPSGGSWIAFLGTLEPRKNVASLIDGYTSATSELMPEERPSLLLAGGEGWDSAVQPAIERARSSGADVRKLGYLPLHQLRSFLGGAQIVAYPSLGEGFGLPVLEAMASGACVLTTRELSLPEVGGDAVAYAGTSAPEIAAALSRLLASPQEREELGRRAIDRAASFTWLAGAERHVDAYERAAA